MVSRFLIAAPSSGSGKTTITLGLLRALKNRGLAVQPFKCGPDYIDTKFHDQASGAHSINLDLFLSSDKHVNFLFDKYSKEADACLVEGVMGLFDGYNKMQGSSAQIAETLNLPVVLVINAKAMAYSVAPLLYGFKNFYPQINLVGAIFNFVGSESHYRFLEEACKDVGIEPLGYFPKNMEIEIPSRHLGLTLDEKYRFDEFADKVSSIAEQYIDIDRLIEITKGERSITDNKEETLFDENFKISVAKDEAFNFMYHENIEALKALGNVTFFSPLKDRELPVSDFVYLPGGYPELYAKELSENKNMTASIKQYGKAGGKILAECGGMMYLSSCLKNKEGEVFPMVGLLDQTATMENMKLKLGYRQFEHMDKNFKGHEFHYSDIQSDLKSIATIYNAKDMEVATKLLRYKNVIASYTHLYWAEHNNILDLFK